MTETSDFLIVDAISAAYDKDKSVIDDISFKLKEGELACLLGPSGCGKTTILRAISGFQNINTGSIELDGKQLSKPGLMVEPEKTSGWYGISGSRAISTLDYCAKHPLWFKPAN